MKLVYKTHQTIIHIIKVEIFSYLEGYGSSQITDTSLLDPKLQEVPEILKKQITYLFVLLFSAALFICCTCSTSHFDESKECLMCRSVVWLDGNWVFCRWQGAA